MDNVEHPVVLVLAPSMELQQAVQDILNRLGCAAEFSATSRGALDSLFRRDFDAALLDPSISPHSMRFVRDARTLQPWLKFIVLGQRDEIEKDQPPSPAEGLVYVSLPPTEASLRDPVLSSIRHKRRYLSEPRHGTQGALNRLLMDLGALYQQIQVLSTQEGGSHLLQTLRNRVAGLVPCAVAGLLEIENNEPVIRLLKQQAVTPEFLQQVEDEMLSCYELLTDQRSIKRPVLTRVEGDPPAEGAAASVGSLLTIPVTSGEQTHGILTFASPLLAAYPPSEAAFLRHLISHVSAIFPNMIRMQHMAIRDSLTNLYNRGHFDSELQKVWLLSQRYGHPMGVIMMDVDGLKTLNDSYGHLVGDSVLHELAHVLTQTARATDIIARYGGDEMAVVLPNADARQSQICAERFLTAIAQHVFCKNQHPLNLSVSIGVAASSDPGVANEIDLLTLADRSCYLAKENGKGRVCTVSQMLAQKQPAGNQPRSIIRQSILDTPSTESAGRLLVVDDEPAICQTFEAMLTDKGLDVTTETDAHRAIEIVRSRASEIDVVLTDLRMPEMDGIQLLDAVQKISPDIVTIVVTGFSSTESAIAAMRVGAYDFVRKPVDFDELEFVVKRGIERRRLRRQVESYRQQLESTLDDRTKSLRETLEALENSYMVTMEALTSMLALRETHTAHHDHRVGVYSLVLGRRMGMGETQLETLRRGALLHDIGKIGVPDAILQKPGPLTDVEWESMRRHPEIAYHILRNIPFLKDEAEMVYSHHERFDGTGYPRRLAGEAICLGARIFAVVDTFDALTSDRVYRRAVNVEQAIEEIRAVTGTQFDPAVVDVFLQCYKDFDLPEESSAHIGE